METFYLIDFENVHDEGLKNKTLEKNNHIHIFYTENAPKISLDYAEGITPHKVPAGKQSLDMHLVSYLGYLLCNKGKQCSYVIISKDSDYDNIIKFWKEVGYQNISRQAAISNSTSNQKKAVTQATKTINCRTNEGISHNFSGEDRSKLNRHLQQKLSSMGYNSKTSNRICKIVIDHCNDERMLNGIHNDIKATFADYSEVYKDIKSILGQFNLLKNQTSQKEQQVRSFFFQHFIEKIYIDKKEEIIHIVLDAQSRQQVNNKLLKLYHDGSIVTKMLDTLQPLIKNLPGK